MENVLALHMLDPGGGGEFSCGDSNVSCDSGASCLSELSCDSNQSHEVELE